MCCHSSSSNGMTLLAGGRKALQCEMSRVHHIHDTLVPAAVHTRVGACRTVQFLG
eukprot:m.26842 g.26842  ORF g.26842 m.26842 type:complete len:55 (-) comp8879_c0_seq2:88-252(-)